jgi:hypothetical protein
VELQEGDGHEWNLMMEWMKFIILDTWSKGRLKLKRRSHLEFVAASILNRKGRAGPGGLSIFSVKDFDPLAACQGFAARLLAEFPFFRSRSRKGVSGACF